MAEPSESRNSSGCNRRGSALVDLIACPGSTQELDGMDFVKALDELRDIPELKDAMALLELNQTANQKSLARAGMFKCYRGEVDGHEGPNS